MSKKVQPKQKLKNRRVNVRALIVLGVLLLIAIPGVIVAKLVRDHFGRAAYLKEAKAQLELGKPALAIGYLTRYLELAPDDLEALDLKAKILFDGARDGRQVKEALNVHTQLIAAQPTDPRWEPARRRMAKLNLMIGQPKPALDLANALKGDDAEVHRLRARALAGVGQLRESSTMVGQAYKEYEIAEAKDPGDVETAETFANYYRDEDDAIKAQDVLDHLVEATAKFPKKQAAALLARSRHFAQSRQPGMSRAEVKELIDKAEADIDEATRKDPDGLEPRLLAAEVAIQRRDSGAARQHLAAIAEPYRNDRRLKIVEGLIDLSEQRPDEAVRIWRAGLLQMGGNDTELTWKLANVLLEMGRVSDAEPLIAQYLRLVGGDKNDPRYAFLRATALLKANRPTDVYEVLTSSVIAKTPKALLPQSLHTLGQAYEATHNIEKAIDAYEQATANSQNWGAPWAALARLQALTHPKDALATLHRGLALIPGDHTLLAAQAQLLFAEEIQKAPEARSMVAIESLLKQADKESDGSAEVAVIRAQYYVNTGQNENALSLLEAATKQHPKAPELWLARANLLTRLGRLGDAQAILGDASTQAGPQSVFYVSRATILVTKGQINEARKTLVDGLAHVPAEQKPPIWKTLGEVYMVQKDYESARAAFDEWSKLQPKNPEPRLAEFRLAMLQNDDDAINRAINAVREFGGEKSYFWRLAKVEYLLRDRKEKSDPKHDAARFDEAGELITEIEKNDPQLPLGYVLEGRLRERRKQVDKAIEAYKIALKHDAGESALNPLLALLAREGRDAELDRLGKMFPAFAKVIDKQATQNALVSGKSVRAQELAEKAVKGDPDGLNTRVWEAEVLNSLGKPKEAEAKARKLIAERPTEATPWLLLLMLQINRREIDAAAETVEQMRKQVKTEYPELLWAQCYRTVGKMREAVDCNQEAVRRWPNDMAVLMPAANFYEQIGRRDASEETLRLIRRRDPSSVWARRQLAMSLGSHVADRPSWEEAVALVGATPQPNDTTDDLMVRAAIFAQATEPANRRKAVEILEGVLVEQPDNVRIHEQLGRLLLGMDDAAAARPHAARAAQGESATTEAILFYAALLLSQKDTAGAEEQLARLIKREPNGLAVAELKARVLAAQGKGSEAAEILERAYDDRIATPEGLSIGEKLIQILLGLNQPEAAERVARRIAALAPKGRCLLAELLAGQGKLDQAVEELDKAAKAGDPSAASVVALAQAVRPAADARWAVLADRYFTEASKSPDPDQQPGAGSSPSFQTLERLSLLRHLQQNYKEEVSTYIKMIDAKPPNYLFLNNLAWTLSEELNKPEDGLKYVDDAIKKMGPQPHILDTRGVILTRLGRYDDAVRDLEAAAQWLRDPSVYYHLTRAYVRMGKPDLARKSRDRALQAGLGPEQLQGSERADWDAVMKNP